MPPERSTGRASRGGEASTSYRESPDSTDEAVKQKDDDAGSDFSLDSLARAAPSDWDDWEDEDKVDEEEDESKEEEEQVAEETESRTSVSGAETPQEASNKRRRVDSPFGGKDFIVLIPDVEQKSQKAKGKRPAKLPSIEDLEDSDEDVIHVQSEDEANGKKRKAPTTSKAKTKYVSNFAKKQPFKKIPGLPTKVQAGEMFKAAKKKAEDGEYPPIHSLPDIFLDLVKRAPNLELLAKTLQDRPLRIATMCSGTESPILAWRLIERAVKEHTGIQMQHHHVFSCEIEPYKQAYIQRNFEPPLLFRDVCELGEEQAYTAFGSLADVPGNVDILIAGTSCVDYSALNNQKKALEDGGESGRTFHGMLDWVEKHKPAVVILENVKGAPWGGVAKWFNEINYDAEFDISLDTKNHYIPHTRQRGYLIATRNNKDSLPENWKNLTQSLIRPSSNPLEAFLLPVDDPRIQQVRDGFANGEGYGKGRSTTDWSRCQVRHAFAREDESLGQGRPYTEWKEGGACKLPDGAWNDFALPQPERVVDLCDITTLRGAKRGFDPHYKCQVWELSQNVDRNIASSKPGICPCLTPNGMPFLTFRGGPLIGLEALSLQGLPLDELLLTRETNDQLQNLAGNAMSSTVVGTCMLAALIVVQADLVKDGEGRDIEMQPSQLEQSKRIEDNITGEENLRQEVNDLVQCDEIDMPELLQKAAAASQKCSCEGRVSTTSAQIYRCKECNHTACSKCKGRPEHQYEVDPRERIEPATFLDAVKGALQMRLEASELSATFIKQLGEGQKGLGKSFEAYRNRVSEALSSAEFRLSKILRQQVWLVQYEAPAATLELFLDPVSPYWRITVHADSEEPVSSGIRPLLLQPIAMMQLDPLKNDTNLFHGEWTLCLPSKQKFDIQVRSFGPQIPSWQASLGIQGDHLDKRRFSKVEIKVPEEAQALLRSEVNGIYDLLPQCGTANGSLHLKAGDTDAPNDRKLFFFLDADRFKEDKNADRYVFSTDTARVPYPLERITVASIEGGWRPKLCRSKEAEEATEKTQLEIAGVWVTIPDFSIAPLSQEAAESHVSILKEPIAIDLAVTTCEQATAVLSCSAKVSSSERTNSTIWPQDGRWKQIDLVHHSKTTFDELNWMMQRLPEVSALGDWMQAIGDETKQSLSCNACAPAEPTLLWHRRKGKAPIPIEDDQQAGPYEQALKNRPSPFVMQVRLGEEKSTAHVRLGVNTSTLMHRALSRLPQGSNSSEPGGATSDAVLSWRLSKIDRTLTLFNLPKYTLTSNRSDAEAENPNIFKKWKLRPEQKRSLTWMLKQEADDVKPFQEEEVSEALLAPLGWRAEGKALRSVTARGGVLADDVGYGKTAISLGLIAASPRRGKAPRLPSKDEAKTSNAITDETHISTKATLIVVPPHLCKQWQNEVTKFTGKNLQVVLIQSKQELNKTTIESILEADIVIMSITVYKSDAYFETFARFAASNPLPNKEGRFFNSMFKASSSALRNRVRELKSEGATKVMESTKAKIDSNEALFTDKATTITRKIGRRAFNEAHEGKGKKKAKDEDEKMDVDNDEDEEPKIKAKVAADPWGLESKATVKDFTQMKCPPLEMFYWNRVVIDEFHYIAESGGRALPAVTSLQAHSKWVLSGTPPTADFADVKSIAVFLNIHLGVSDDQDTTKNSVRTRRDRDRTVAEKFQNFVEMRSPAWHHRRQAVAQAFLDQFVRQNVAEIDEIPFSEITAPVLLPAAERACYLELNHVLLSLQARYAGRNLYSTGGKVKSKKAQEKDEKKLSHLSDRDARLRRTLGESASQDEALSRQAAHFTLETNENETHDALNALEACNSIVKEREKQRDGCLAQFKDELKRAQRQHDLVLLKFSFRNPQVQALVRFSENALKVGDQDSIAALREALESNNCMPKDLTKSFAQKRMPPAEIKVALNQRKKERKEAGIKDEDGDKSSTTRDWDEETLIRNKAHALQKLRNEYVQRECALRYFLAVRKLQHAQLIGSDDSFFCPSPICDKKGEALDLSNVGLSSTCGHIACWSCMKRDSYLSKCCDPNCSMGSDKDAIVQASTLGVEKGNGTKYGIKLAHLATLIKKGIPKKEKVLLFVQFEGLLQKVSDALEDYGIDFVRIQGSASARSTQLASFQEENCEDRVLLLNIADESAAGSNLTCANHVIFLSPLVTEEQQQYHATMKQAKGRAIRFGQVKDVKIWRFICTDTIDQKTYEEREGEKLNVEEKLKEYEELTNLVEVEDVSDDKKQKKEDKVKGTKKETKSKGKGKKKAVDEDDDMNED